MLVAPDAKIGKESGKAGIGDPGKGEIWPACRHHGATAVVMEAGASFRVRCYADRFTTLADGKRAGAY